MTTATQSTETMSKVGSGPPAADRRGATIGRYTLLDLLGSGGMGVVYSAYDAQLDRKVAIKILHPRVMARGDQGDVGARLLREAQAMARLSHPNVVTVHDVGTFEGSVFLAMEYVRGSTLRQWLDAKRPWRQRLEAVEAAGRGLAAAHRAGLVHRDFKPENVLVGEDGRVRVTDFGIARADDSSLDHRADAQPTTRERPLPDAATRNARRGDSNAPTQSEARSEASRRDEVTPPSSGLLDTPLTATGSVLGTIGYMAPEQALGETVDARSDQFSFCATLHVALYGAKPFASSDLGSYITALGKPVAAAPGDTDVPVWVRRVILRGLSDDPSKRFPSMDTLLAALADDPAIRRRRWLLVAGAAALVGVTGIAVTRPRPAAPALCTGAQSKLEGVWSAAKKTQVHAALEALHSPLSTDVAKSVDLALDDYAARWVTMRTDACAATRLRGEQSEELLDLRMECLDERLREMGTLANELGHVDAETLERAPMAARSLTSLAVCADKAALTAPVRPPTDPAVRAQVESVKQEVAEGLSHYRLGRYEEARKVAVAAVARARTVEYRPLLAEALSLLGDTQIALGEDRLAPSALIEAEATAIAGKEPFVTTHALANLVLDSVHLVRFEQGHVWSQLAEAAATASGDPVAQATSAEALSQLLLTEHRLDEARVAAERAITLWEGALGKDDMALADPLTDLANIEQARGDYERARVLNERAIAVVEKAVGRNALVASNVNNLGDACQRGGDFDCAIAAYAQANTWYEQAHGHVFFGTAITLSNLAEAWRLKGDVARALPMSLEAVEIMKKTYGPEDPMTGTVVANLAETYRALGSYALALSTFERALAMKEKALGPEDAELAPTLTGLGRTLLDLRRPAAARAELTRALAIVEAHAGDPFDAAETRFALARAVAPVDAARARELASKARASFATAGPRGAPLVAEVDAWLAKGG